jgi:hypothetical protein
MPASKQSGRGEVGSMDGWGQTLDYILHTRLEFNLPQDIDSLNERSRSSARSLENRYAEPLLVLPSSQILLIATTHWPRGLIAEFLSPR